MPSLTTLAAQSIPDPEQRAVALRAMTAAQLTMEKAVAHTAEPARYPLPSDARSIERLFLSRFEALDRSVKRDAAGTATSALRTPTQPTTPPSSPPSPTTTTHPLTSATRRR
ncbi:MAG: hypothetical protein ACRDJE_05980 [Dehalococcoidia bacterium]